ncbi:MAG: c-type cytochrome [Bacteroidetes bacterium]|nr:c-type cytochrome [Bacteroidota bacterium]
MKTVFTSAMVVLAASLFIGATNVHNAATGSDGKSIFLENKCNTCHSIDALGIKRTSEPKPGEVIPSDLSGAGLTHDASWLDKWLMKEVELKGQKHLKKFKGSDGDRDILCKWLASLKTKPKK